MRGLSARQIAVTRAIASALFDCPDEDRGAQERIAWTLGELGQTLRRAGWQTALAFRLALLVVQFAPIFLLGRLRRFVRLALADRCRCLDRLEGSPLRLVLVLLKTTLCLHYFEHPAALERMGYDGFGWGGPAWAPDAEPPVRRALPVLAERRAAEGA